MDDFALAFATERGLGVGTEFEVLDKDSDDAALVAFRVNATAPYALGPAGPQTLEHPAAPPPEQPMGDEPPPPPFASAALGFLMFMVKTSGGILLLVGGIMLLLKYFDLTPPPG